MLARKYRFTVLNDTGVTIAQNQLTVKARRWKFNSSGVKVYETNESTVLIMDSAGGLADNYYFSGTVEDNSTDLWDGGDFELQATTTGSPSGDVAVYYEPCTDDGTDFPTNGLGRQLCRINFAAAGTKQRVFEL